MKKLLSLPTNLVEAFHDVEGLDACEYFCTSDPVGRKLGSGGGTAWLLTRSFEAEQTHSSNGCDDSFADWLSRERRVLIHAGGQSRRLPAYAPAGKVLTPIPPLHGEPYGETLLALQLPLYERIMHLAPQGVHTLIASGDVYISASEHLRPLPEADVICYGLPASQELISHHGVYVMPKSSPERLDFMLQKPSVQRQQELAETHLFLMDIGIWLLSDRAVELLMKRSVKSDGEIGQYDLYGEFGTALGLHPSCPDDELSQLSVAILPLPEGRFLHFGTSQELISSTEVLTGQPNPKRLWVENSNIDGWTLTEDNIVTGVPDNDWKMTLSPGLCVDVVPVGEDEFALRPYGIRDAFRGRLSDVATTFLGQPIGDWLAAHRLSAEDIEGNEDIQQSHLFPLSKSIEELGALLHWMLSENMEDNTLYISAKRLSADQLSNQANLRRCQRQRQQRREKTFAADRAFAQLRERMLTSTPLLGVEPHIETLTSPVRGEAPVRADISGGWTDTPPFCLYHGGSVVNFAFDLDGCRPLSCEIAPIAEPVIRLRSIDLQACEDVTTWEQLHDYAHVNSPFTIPKAALAQAGFLPEFVAEGCRSTSLREQLGGRGFSLTMESRVPAGSGLGTSSILAAVVLGTLSKAFGFGWSPEEVCRRTLVLEQMLTAGGGWQDQYGGVFAGAKLLTTCPGDVQQPMVETLPDVLWTHPDLAPCHLLYFTGITRTAKSLLALIVRDMFLRRPDQRHQLDLMKERAQQMADVIRQSPTDPHRSLEEYGRMLRLNWLDNQRLDGGCNPPAVQQLSDRIDDLALGYKLPGAGGGGFLYVLAKDPEAALRIRQILLDNRPSPTARFYELSLSSTGLIV